MILLLVRPRRFARGFLVLTCLALLLLLPLARIRTCGRIFQVRAARRVPIYSVVTDEKKVSLTFNAASWETGVGEILKALREHEAKATFFLLGTWVERYPETAKTIAAEGHELGLHSHTHPDMTRLSAERIRTELLRNRQIIRDTTGVQATLFRPPFGAYNDLLLQVAEDEISLVTIQWSVDSLDWKGIPASEISGRILAQTREGSIVLFHTDAPHTPAALPSILRELYARGYRVVPVSQLLHSPPYAIDHQGRQHKKQ